MPEELKPIREMWFEAERKLAEFRRLNHEAKEKDDMASLIEASKARDKWRRAKSDYNRACIHYVTELIQEIK